MQVSLLTQIEQLETLAGEWRTIVAGHPFLGPDWLIPWWKHVGRDPSGANSRRLASLAVHDPQGNLVALAPWYVEQSRLHGRTLKFLGSGEVCSDYLTIACRQGDEPTAMSALAGWLSAKNAARSIQDPGLSWGWDLLCMEAVNLADPCTARFIQTLENHGAIVSRREAGNCWHIALPDTFEAYLSKLSKTNRKRVRRLDREYLQTGRAKIRKATNQASLAEGFQILVALHTKRWRSRGKTGIFAQPGIQAFHQEVTTRMLESGHLRLSWLEVDGQPAAVDYSLTDGRALFCYQAGMDPDLLHYEPGVLSLIASVQELLTTDCQEVDFLRGDEPYKLDWRAQPRPIHDVRILPSSLPSHLRQSIWSMATGVKDLLRAGRDAMISHSETVSAFVAHS